MSVSQPRIKGTQIISIMQTFTQKFLIKIEFFLENCRGE